MSIRVHKMQYLCPINYTTVKIQKEVNSLKRERERGWKERMVYGKYTQSIVPLRTE